MKKTYFFILIIIFIGQVGCKKSKNAPELQKPDSEVTGQSFEYIRENTIIVVDYKAGSTTFEFTSNVATWVATSSVDWLTVADASKSGGKGKQTLNFNFTENTTEADREAKITISSGKTSFEITVNQMKNLTAFEFTEGTKFIITVGFESGSETFTFTSNVENWVATSSVDWLTVADASKSGGKGKQTLNFNFTENTTKADREAKISVSKGELSFEFMVRQVNDFDIFSIMNPTLKQRCQIAGYDTNNDGRLSFAEAKQIKKISVYNTDIESLNGIEYLINLEELTANQCRFSSLDLSYNTALISLLCGGKNLTKLDVSKCTKLKQLGVSYTSLPDLDVSNNTMLEVLNCEHNSLIELDVSNNTKLSVLFCNENPLKTIYMKKGQEFEEFEKPDGVNIVYK